VRKHKQPNGIRVKCKHCETQRLLWRSVRYCVSSSYRFPCPMKVTSTGTHSCHLDEARPVPNSAFHRPPSASMMEPSGRLPASTKMCEGPLSPVEPHGFHALSHWQPLTLTNLQCKSPLSCSLVVWELPNAVSLKHQQHQQPSWFTVSPRQLKKLSGRSNGGPKDEVYEVVALRGNMDGPGPGQTFGG